MICQMGFICDQLKVRGVDHKINKNLKEGLHFDNKPWIKVVDILFKTIFFINSLHLINYLD
jgi:hypothetical protein